MLLFVGHFAGLTVSRLVALGSCSVYISMQNFVSLWAGRKEKADFNPKVKLSLRCRFGMPQMQKLSRESEYKV